MPKQRRTREQCGEAVVADATRSSSLQVQHRYARGPGVARRSRRGVRKCERALTCPAILPTGFS